MRIFIVLFVFSVLPCGLLFYNTVNKVDEINRRNMSNYTQNYKGLMENRLETAVYKNVVQCIKMFADTSIAEIVDDVDIPKEIRQERLCKAIAEKTGVNENECLIHILNQHGEEFYTRKDKLPEDKNYINLSDSTDTGSRIDFGNIVYDSDGNAYVVMVQSLKNYDYFSGDKKVLMFIKLDIFNNYYRSIVNDSEAVCFITNEKNEIIFSNNEEFINSQNIFNLCLNEETKQQQEFTIGDKHYVYTSDKMVFSNRNMPGDLSINMLLPKSFYYESVNRFFYTSSITFVLMIILLAIIGTLLSYALVKPIRTIEQRVKIFGQGELGVTLPDTHNDEVGELKNMIESMFVQIRNLMRNNTEILEAKHKSEFEVLQAQINPHFIYNTLDSISSIAKIEGQPEIEELVYALSNFFKISLHNGDRYISIEEEIEHIKSYIKIQEIRWPGRFKVEFFIEEEILGCEIIKIILQPFVENAIKYAFEGKSETGIIKIKAYRSEQFIVFEIEDNGCGFDSSIIKKADYKGVGIRNTSNRIAYEYGDECGIEFSEAVGGGTLVKIKVLCLEDM